MQLRFIASDIIIFPSVISLISFLYTPDSCLPIFTISTSSIFSYLSNQY